MANPAAAVCYPGQLLFLLPLPLLWAQKLYVVGHVLLAAATAFLLARAFRASTTAAGVCALAYAFSGNVLMQHTNAPFLVGAAWLPLAVLCAERMPRLAIGTPTRPCGDGSMARPIDSTSRPQAANPDLPSSARGPCGKKAGRTPAVWWSLGLAVVLAMMALGGDPQMAYNVGLMAGLYVAMTLAAHSRRRRSETGKGYWSLRHLPWAACRRSVCLFGSAGLVAFVLAAVQVLPSWQFAARSNRLRPSWGERLTARLEPRSHHEHVYHFSVGPWRLAEFLWPNVSGRQYPVHRRWLDVIPAEGRIWTPTLYMGILPLVFGLSAMRFRRGPLRLRWLSWLALLSTMAGFGYYGLGWLMAEVQLDTGLVGGPFGGPYWLMNLLLPGYARFRYPAKLLVVTALAISILAARGWDRAFAGHCRPAYRLLFWLGVASFVGLLGAFAVRPLWSGWMGAVPADSLFGPLDAAGAWRDLASGFAQTLLLCVTFRCLLQTRGKAMQGRGGRLVMAVVPHAALLLVAADLGWSNAWLVVTAPEEVAESPSRFGQRISGASAERRHSGEPVSPRVWRYPIWLPAAWRASGSADRLTESMRFDRDTVWPNYHLDLDIGVVEVQGTMMLRDYAGFLAARRTAAAEGRVTVFDLASYAVLPPSKKMPRPWQEVDRVPGAVLWRNGRPLPRAWIAEPDSPGRPRNLEAESCRVVHFDPQRVTVEASLLEPGLVVLAEQFYPGWRLEVSSGGEGARDVPIERANDIMRAAALPAGVHRLTFLFRPRIVSLGAAISGAGWLALTGCVLWGFAQRWRS